MNHPVAIMILVLCCVSCAKNSSPEKAETSKKVAGLPFKCSGSPPIFDSSKIEQMLRNNGTISDDMKSLEVEQTVNDFIQRKQKKFKDCSKP